MAIDLIYCAGGNPRFSQIAHEEGWQMGVRSDESHAPGYPIVFVDVDYKKPDFEKHLARVAKEQPRYASVPDLSDKIIDEQDIARAVERAERLKDYCETVLIVPKLCGQIQMLPAGLAIGYSVPTSYGGAQYPIWELADRRVHILGGSLHEQIKAYRYIESIGHVTSVDGNMSHKIALQFCKVWECGRWVKWDKRSEKDEQYNAFRQSCKNIREAWNKEQDIETTAA